MRAQGAKGVSDEDDEGNMYKDDEDRWESCEDSNYIENEIYVDYSRSHYRLGAPPDGYSEDEVKEDKAAPSTISRTTLPGSNSLTLFSLYWARLSSS